MSLTHARLLREDAGRALRTLRLAAGLHPVDLGLALGSTHPETAAQRVAALESGGREPDERTYTVLRTVLGTLPEGWEQARALEQAANRARAAVQSRDLDLLAAVFPRLVAQGAKARRNVGWCDVRIHAPASAGWFEDDATGKVVAFFDGRLPSVLDVRDGT